MKENGIEQIAHCLWDSGPAPAAKTTRYFVDPAGPRKHSGETNMIYAGTLHPDHTFLVKEIGWSGASSQTLGTIELRIGSKPYFTAPLTLGAIRIWQTIAPYDLLLTSYEFFCVEVKLARGKRPLFFTIALNGILARPIQ
jgi:hypothetical protein